MAEMKDIADLTDEELLAEAKKHKNAKITNAVLIGFLIGILVYSAVAASSVGFFSLIILYMIYRFAKSSEYDEETLEFVLKQRNLK